MAGLDAEVKTRLRSFELSVRIAVGRETVALVGPSGSGKTTLLRAIAGLIRPDSGRIAMAGEAWFDSAGGVMLAPERRSVGLVFQEYALFPHLSVRENVAFAGAGRADALLRRLRIEHLERERPAVLSGGERQRVALARALARDPQVLLLDEPLAALDAHTRAAVRDELQGLLTGLGIPTLLVTHDFRDAAALAQRVAVIADGRLRQLGTVAELVAAPADSFVAAFTGASVLAGTATPTADGGATVALDGGGVARCAHPASGRVGVAVYPWEVALCDAPPGGDPAANVLERVVTACAPDEGRVRVRLGELAADAARGAEHRPGDRRWATFSAAAARVVALD